MLLPLGGLVLEAGRQAEGTNDHDQSESQYHIPYNSNHSLGNDHQQCCHGSRREEVNGNVVEDNPHCKVDDIILYPW